MAGDKLKLFKRELLIKWMQKLSYKFKFNLKNRILTNLHMEKTLHMRSG